MFKTQITIVGGGTAGLITALVLKIRLDCDVKVLVPSDIGIIGVGEGSTEHWAEFVKFIGDTLTNSLVKTKGTIKSGIYFNGWTPERGDYIHSLPNEYLKSAGMTPINFLKFWSEGWTNEEFISTNLKHNMVANMYDFQGGKCETGGWQQFHFNTVELNNYLTEHALSRGIEIIDDKILEVKQDQNGISECVGEKQNYKADIWIDCTGFKKVLISELGAKWESYEKYLPLKEAIAFPTEELNYYPIHTEAKVMKAGWKWQIPTYGRFGNGYIFDTDYITKDEAHQEVNEMFGREIEIAKHIKFNPGKLDKVCIKNCVAVGLSANFLEPLEATSIGTSINQAFLLMHMIIDGKISENDSKKYNKTVNDIMVNSRDFVALHYINDNRSSEFWKNCARLPRPESLLNYLDIWKGRPLDELDVDDSRSFTLFKEHNFNYIAYSHGLLSSDVCKKYLHSINPTIVERLYNQSYQDSLQYTLNHTSQKIYHTPHKDYIQQLHKLNGDHNNIVFQHYYDKKNLEYVKEQ